MDNESENEASSKSLAICTISDNNDDAIVITAETELLVKVSKNQVNLTNEEANTVASSITQSFPQSSTATTPKKKRRLFNVPQLDTETNDLLKSPNPDMLEPDLREFENESKRIRSDINEDFVDLSDIKLDKCFKNELDARKAYLQPPIHNPLKSRASFSFNDFLNRDMGLIKPTKFQEKILNSLDHLKRMKSCKSLDYHDGCVNALNFNRIGTLLASASDDCQVCIWDWGCSRPIINFNSGHKSNVFQVKQNL
jgi:hypothetical protein